MDTIKLYNPNAICLLLVHFEDVYNDISDAKGTFTCS